LLACTPTPSSFIRQGLVENLDMLAVCPKASWKYSTQDESEASSKRQENQTSGCINKVSKQHRENGKTQLPKW